MADEFMHLRQTCFECNMQLPAAGLVKYTFGNVSVVNREKNIFAIKPSGVPYEKLKSEDIVIVNFDNQVIDGALSPSSDTKTHAVLYKTWEHIGGIVHSHSTYAVAWAQAQKDIPILGTTHADHLPFNIPCAEIMSDAMVQGDYEYETGNQILKCLKKLGYSYLEVEMILVASHGPFTWGKTADKAVYNSVILEELAKMAYLTLQINPDTPNLKETLIKKHFERKHGKNAYYGQK